MKIAIYARFGNKEESKLTEQEQKEEMQRISEEMHHIQPRSEPMPSLDELKDKGCEVVTLPKKKAWLLVRSSIPLEESVIKDRFNELKSYAAENGYEVVGETFVKGRWKQVYKKLRTLFLGGKKKNEANVLLTHDVRALGRDLSLIFKLRDELQEKGVQIKGMDDFEKRMVYPQTDLDKSFSHALKLIKNQEETEDLAEQPGPTMGGM